MSPMAELNPFVVWTTALTPSNKHARGFSRLNTFIKCLGCTTYGLCDATSHTRNTHVKPNACRVVPNELWTLLGCMVCARCFRPNVTSIGVELQGIGWMMCGMSKRYGDGPLSGNCSCCLDERTISSVKQGVFVGRGMWFSTRETTSSHGLMLENFEYFY